MRSNLLGSAADFRRGGRSARPLDSHLAQLFLRDLRAPAPARLPIFRSRLQGELLARLLLGPAREHAMLDLAVMLRTDLGSVMREIDRLVRADLLVLRRTTGGRLVARNPASPLFEPLAQLLALTYGPAGVLAEEFGRLRGVTGLHLFGAWAAGHQGGDVEVLVIGAVPPEAAFDAAQEASARLGLPVHAVVRSAAAWAGDDDPFLREIRAGRTVQISPSAIR
ncbi:ArsR family transcriptional regulator [Actinomadura macrotermitis]|uniref:ArsR family transcriptional regulator n=1 Tax=Actinomadura macrotermitis TaxID=2585200 RepID=A0A7K0BXR0_9ACTN|nr:ArsR family transcriptional regulator [Actinomadura macrotermitis]MQY05978.1 hypothetical protein [Actinomadura macrotermitis]